jgi:hypothetical protein
MNSRHRATRRPRSLARNRGLLYLTQSFTSPKHWSFLAWLPR